MPLGQVLAPHRPLVKAWVAWKYMSKNDRMRPAVKQVSSRNVSGECWISGLHRTAPPALPALRVRGLGRAKSRLPKVATVPKGILNSRMVNRRAGPVGSASGPEAPVGQYGQSSVAFSEKAPH